MQFVAAHYSRKDAKFRLFEFDRCKICALPCLMKQEVVLIRDTEDPRAFYPRYGLEGTASFADLNHHT